MACRFWWPEKNEEKRKKAYGQSSQRHSIAKKEKIDIAAFFMGIRGRYTRGIQSLLPFWMYTYCRKLYLKL